MGRLESYKRKRYSWLNGWPILAWGLKNYTYSFCVSLTCVWRCGFILVPEIRCQAPRRRLAPDDCLMQCPRTSPSKRAQNPFSQTFAVLTCFYLNQIHVPQTPGVPGLPENATFQLIHSNPFTVLWGVPYGVRQEGGRPWVPRWTPSGFLKLLQ